VEVGRPGSGAADGAAGFKRVRRIAPALVTAAPAPTAVGGATRRIVPTPISVSVPKAAQARTGGKGQSIAPVATTLAPETAAGCTAGILRQNEKDGGVGEPGRGRFGAFGSGLSLAEMAAAAGKVASADAGV
jgi:hypothetical protein